MRGREELGREIRRLSSEGGVAASSIPPAGSIQTLDKRTMSRQYVHVRELEEDFTRAYRDLVAMIASERDARRADVKGLREDIQAIERRLAEMDRRLADGDERTFGFETAAIESIGRFHSTVMKALKAHESLETRVSALEQWRRDQAS